MKKSFVTLMLLISLMIFPIEAISSAGDYIAISLKKVTVSNNHRSQSMFEPVIICNLFGSEKMITLSCLENIEAELMVINSDGTCYIQQMLQITDTPIFVNDLQYGYNYIAMYLSCGDIYVGSFFIDR